MKLYASDKIGKKNQLVKWKKKSKEWGTHLI
jgi:hypothetical protein